MKVPWERFLKIAGCLKSPAPLLQPTATEGTEDCSTTGCVLQALTVPGQSWVVLVARLSPWRKLGDAIIGTSTPAWCPVYPLCTPAAKHPGTVHLLAGLYWEQRGDMQGLHCPRAGSSWPGTGHLWSTAAESCAFPTVCAKACGCSPSVPVPACGSSTPAWGQSCSVAPTEVTGAGVSTGGPLVPQNLLQQGEEHLTFSIRGWSRLPLHLREGLMLGPVPEHRRTPQAQGNSAHWGNTTQPYVRVGHCGLALAGPDPNAEFPLGTPSVAVPLSITHQLGEAA